MQHRRTRSSRPVKQIRSYAALPRYIVASVFFLYTTTRYSWALDGSNSVNSARTRGSASRHSSLDAPSVRSTGPKWVIYSEIS